MYAMTAAHKKRLYRLGTVVPSKSNLDMDGKSVQVRIGRDRGPYVLGRIISICESQRRKTIRN